MLQKSSGDSLGSYETRSDLHALSNSEKILGRFEETRIPQVISHPKLDRMEREESIPDSGYERNTPVLPEVQEADASPGKGTGDIKDRSSCKSIQESTVEECHKKGTPCAS